VYVAEQEETVRRRVALKIIKLGMDTKQVIARFDAALRIFLRVGRISLWNWSAESKSPTAESSTNLARANGSTSSSRFAAPSSTRIKRASSTAISNHRTSSSPRTMACRCRR
jgi:hypothetical protein